MDFFDTSNFPPRWTCGEWPEHLGWMHIISDIIIFAAYILIPTIILLYMRKKPQLYFSKLFILFSLFIMFCGIGHLLEAIIFWYPIYPLAGITKVMTAIVSAATVGGLFYYTPKALKLPELSQVNKELIKEINSRKETERKLVERTAELEALGERLNHERSRLIEAQRMGNIGDWSYDLQTGEIFWSEQVYLLFQRDSKLGPPKDTDENGKYYTPDSLKKLNADIDHAVQGKQTENDYEIVLPNGETAWHYSNIIPEFDAKSGEVIKLRGTVQDITERRNQEGLFKSVVESSPAAMALCDEQGVISLVNRETINLFGYTEHELIGQNIELLVPDEFKSTHPELRNKYMANPQRRGMGTGKRLQGKCKDGQHVYVEIALNPINIRNQLFVLASIIDVSKSVEQEEQINQYAKRLEEINTELSQFTSMASHDLKEPLRKLRFFSDLILNEHENLSPRQIESGQRLSNTAIKMQHLIEGLLVYSKLGKDQLEFTEISIQEKVVFVLSELSHDLAGIKHNIEIDITPKSLTWHLDGVLFEQLLFNLIGNAIKYRSEHRDLSLGIRACEEHNCLKLQITDNGIGFDPKFNENIFNAFTRLQDKSKSGSGIGLAICYKICELMNGSIEAQGQLNQGAQFTVIIKGNKNGQ